VNQFGRSSILQVPLPRVIFAPMNGLLFRLLESLRWRDKRVRTAAGLLSIALGVVAYLGLNFIENYGLPVKRIIFGIPTAALLAGSAIALGGLGVVFLLVAYLRGDYDSHRAAESDSELQEDLRDFLRSISLSRLREGADDNASDAVRKIAEIIDAGEPEGVPRKEDAPKAPPSDAIRLERRFGSTRHRLEREIQALNRRGNLNLAIGVAVTIGAMFLLVYLVSAGHGTKFSDLSEVLSFYIPRISTVVLIEVFAYFFLSLYKQNLAEIKYYQNELTTLAVQEIAWICSTITDTVASKESVVQILAKSDRNSSGMLCDGGLASGKSEDLGGLLEVLQTVSKLIVNSAKGKE
jgi:hypothetical protein